MNSLSNIPQSHCKLGSPERPVRRIVILRALQLGDLLCTVPAFRALRAQFPEAHIALVGLPWAQEFVQRFSIYIDRWIEFPGYPGLPEREPQIERLPAFFEAMQQEQWDVAIQMHGSGSYVNSIVVLFKSAQMAGFYLPNAFCPDPERFYPFAETAHEIRQPLNLLKFLGISADDDSLEFPLTASDRRECAMLKNELSIGDDYVCVHAGSRLLSRRWPPERFAAVADNLAAQGHTIVLTGADSEAEVVGRVQAAMHHRAINLVGKTSLGSLAALLSQAALLLSNDTGVSHVAAAVKTASVIVYSGSNPERWAPLDHQLHARAFHPIACRPCAHFICPIGHPCAQSVSADEVSAQARQLLARSYAL